MNKGIKVALGVALVAGVAVGGYLLLQKAKEKKL